jgi:hypothetical protein
MVGNLMSQDYYIYQIILSNLIMIKNNNLQTVNITNFKKFI